MRKQFDCVVNGKSFKFEKMDATDGIETLSEISNNLLVNKDLLEVIKSLFQDDLPALVIMVAFQAYKGFSGKEFTNFVNTVLYRTKCKLVVGVEDKSVAINRDLDYPEHVFELLIHMLKGSSLFFSNLDAQTEINSAEIMSAIAKAEKVVKVQRP
jgi:hypothetical protein